jgi:hypothetical protein
MVISASGEKAIGRPCSIFLCSNTYDFYGCYGFDERYPYWNGIGWTETRVTALAG